MFGLGGLDLGKMLSGEGGGGLGGMFGGSIMNMVKGQLSSPKTRKMLTGKVVDMADMLCQKFNSELNEEREQIKAATTQRKNEIEAEYNAKSEEDKASSRAETQQAINDLFKEANKKINETIITKYDINLVSKLKQIPAKNENGELMLAPASDGSGNMVGVNEDAVFIEIHVKGIIKQELRLDEFLANMMAEAPEEG